MIPATLNVSALESLFSPPPQSLVDIKATTTDVVSAASSDRFGFNRSFTKTKTKNKKKWK
jgi:hypothetical protein